MEKFTPEFAEEISGVDRNLIIDAARMYATARNGAIFWALGVAESIHGTANALSLINLALVTGHLGRKGTGLNPLRGQNNVQGASDSGAMPWHYPGYMPVDDEASAHKWEQAWNIEPGGLNRALELLEKEAIGIEYMYAFVGKTENEALVIIKVENSDEAVRVLTSNNIRVLTSGEVYKL
jgi:predicted molibdopterin-dependent oxidoreductase YjgC